MLDQANQSVDGGGLLEKLEVSLVITDPRLPDNPIVYCNNAFTELTGYARTAVHGRNCRFLQGADTDPDDVATLSAAISEERSVAVQILNYTASGKAFRNCLVITPIAHDGEVIFFLGVQAGEMPTVAEGFDPETVRDSLSQVEQSVSSSIAEILKMVRDKVRKPSEPHDVVSLLASRINCLAQLYAGVFRQQALEEGRNVRLGAYLSRVCSGTHVADKSYNVRMSTEFVDCVTTNNRAGSIGLVLSELLANAFDNSDPFNDEAEIQVELERNDAGVLELSVRATCRSGRITLMPPSDSVGERMLDTLLPRLKTEVVESVEGDAVWARVLLPTLGKSSGSGTRDDIAADLD